MKKKYEKPSYEVTKFNDFFFACLEDSPCTNIQPDAGCCVSDVPA